MPKPPETITEAKRRLATCPPEQLDALIRRLSKDPRAGVRDLAAAAKARLGKQRAEVARLDAMMDRQLRLHELGFTVVAGIDEVGCGALAGPVAACAVVLDAGCRIAGLHDSKQLTHEARECIADVVRQSALACVVGFASAEEIDRYNIRHATRLAWQRALEGLGMEVGHVLVDGNDAGALGIPTTAVVKGDATVACIAAASVVAKVERDALMVQLAAEYPAYGFDENRGYGTAEHLAAIREFGPSPVHRVSFAPCAPQESLF